MEMVQLSLCDQSFIFSRNAPDVTLPLSRHIQVPQLRVSAEAKHQSAHLSTAGNNQMLGNMRSGFSIFLKTWLEMNECNWQQKHRILPWETLCNIDFSCNGWYPVCLMWSVLGLASDTWGWWISNICVMSMVMFTGEQCDLSLSFQKWFLLFSLTELLDLPSAVRSLTARRSRTYFGCVMTSKLSPWPLVCN